VRSSWLEIERMDRVTPLNWVFFLSLFSLSSPAFWFGVLGSLYVFPLFFPTLNGLSGW